MTMFGRGGGVTAHPDSKATLNAKKAAVPVLTVWIGHFAWNVVDMGCFLGVVAINGQYVQISKFVSPRYRNKFKIGVSGLPCAPLP